MFWRPRADFGRRAAGDILASMPSINISEAAVIPAPSAVVYDIITDYNTGHPSILPPEYFGVSTFSPVGAVQARGFDLR